METRMRRVLTLMTVVAGGSLCLGLSPHDAEALPSSTISVPAAMPTAIESVQYYTRRQLRHRGPVVVVPNAEPSLRGSPAEWRSFDGSLARLAGVGCHRPRLARSV